MKQEIDDKLRFHIQMRTAALRCWRVTCPPVARRKSIP
jgi:hypothetical protein